MKISSLLFAAVCAAALSACTSADVRDNTNRDNTNEVSKTVYAMDTVMTLKAYGENAETALKDAEEEIKQLDSSLRRGNPESEIYKINANGSEEVSEETAVLISDALEICKSTEGAFDISIAPVMDLWGFYTKEFNVPAKEELSHELSRVNYENISVDGNVVSVSSGTQLDLGGIAKGYLSGRIMDIFKNDGVESGIISLGGNVQTLGTKTDGSEWKVAIQNPDDDTYIGGVSVTDKAVITSGGYQRFFEKDGKIYHHIIDPKTGCPADSGIKSVSIVSDNGTLADGLSTALFVMGLEKGTEYWRSHSGFDVIFMTDDNRIYITEGLKDVFESELEYSVITK
ncbi:MAG: FAD:protein FMN transferase [bacterium]|nr:FAD:protein FMN transferase [bacterium]